MRLVAFVTLVVVAVMARLIPHPPNFTPILASALFAGAKLQRRWLAIGVPLIAMVLSDLVLGFHGQVFAVYGAIVLVVCLGMRMSSQAGPVSVGLSSFAASVIFYLITNFAVWAQSGMYAHDLAGLLESYTLALPFFGNSVLGDLLYSGLLFGGWAVVENRVRIFAVARETGT